MEKNYLVELSPSDKKLQSMHGNMKLSNETRGEENDEKWQ